jgi:O-antigen/teichoic acid export membrane protein
VIEFRVETRGNAGRALLWLLSQTASGRAASLLGQLALARLLSPRDFGTIGLTYTLTAVVSSLTASGTKDVLLQRNRTFQIWAWPALWIDLGLASIGAVLIAALAPFAARLYAAPEIAGLACVVAVALPLSALSTIPLTAIRVALDFRFLAAIGTVQVVATQLLAVFLAWYGVGAYSFVAPVPIVAGASAIALWMIVRPHLRRTRPRRAWFYLIQNTFWILGFRLLSGLAAQGDFFILGLLVSRHEVGLYFFAARLSAQPLQALASNVFEVMFPMLARLRQDPTAQHQAALKASRVMAALIFFAGCLQAALATPALHLLFRDRWDDSIRLVQILSIGLAFNAVCWIGVALINAKGEFRRNLIFSLFATPCFFIMVWLGAYFGRSAGAAISVALSYIIMSPILTYVAMRNSVSWIRIVQLYLSALALACAAVVPAFALTHLLFRGDLALAQVASIAVIAPALYVGLLWLSMPELFATIRLQIASIFPTVRGNRSGSPDASDPPLPLGR